MPDLTLILNSICRLEWEVGQALMAGAPIIADIAKVYGILTVGIVTTPFCFEGRRRAVQAQEGIASLRIRNRNKIVVP
jgi:cell division GTPase FtsZ